jgi:hypothetical protein
VEFEILEGDEGEISLAYFFIEFHGVRQNPNDWLSIDFTTREGSAKAGMDYIHTQGTLVLYPDEDYALIPVEIIGNNQPGQDRNFFLDITNPIGGTFAGGMDTLSAMRTIIEDDGYLIG